MDNNLSGDQGKGTIWDCKGWFPNCV